MKLDKEEKKILNAYWELGWIKYKLDDFTSAISTFKYINSQKVISGNL
ncbi:MAG: hypothetical protein NTV16_03035 [Actinobacteria bacterium]|nr:hypothetical protein [Actinomycetota bacterium]